MSPSHSRPLVVAREGKAVRATPHEPCPYSEYVSLVPESSGIEKQGGEIEVV